MTVEAQRPTGRPGTAPRGPAGPRPEPYGPSTPGPQPSAPPPPSPPAPSKAGAADFLRLIDDALIGALAVATTALPPTADRVEACGQEILAFRLRRARAAVADLLQYSGRDGKDIAAAVASRPVQATRPTPGECLTPGSGAAVPAAVTESAGATNASAGVQLPAGRPPLPGGDFLLPRDVRCR